MRMEKSIVLREGYAHLRKTRTAFIGGLLILLVILIGIAVTLGSAEFTVAESYIAILAGLFPGTFIAPEMADIIVWDYRLHRVLFAVVAGFGLAVAGTVMQGILRNPLASPFTLGISSAAATGASIAIVLGAGFIDGEYLIIANAFLFSLLASVAIYGMARYRGVSSETMILAGIALMYLFSAVTSLLQHRDRRGTPGGGLLDVRIGGEVHLAETRTGDPRSRLHHPLPHLPGLGPQRPRRG
ncbi:MAG: iron ABC transporter permease [Methanoculleus sp.]